MASGAAPPTSLGAIRAPTPPGEATGGAAASPGSLRALFDGYTALRRAGRAFAVASVVGVEGSAFRREGARLLVVPDPATDFSAATDEPHTWARLPRPETLGSISGGCLEGEIAWQALDAVRTGRARVVTLTSRLGDDDRAAFGIGCGGTVHVLVQPVAPDEAGPLDAAARSFEARRPGVLAVVTESDLVGRHRFVEAGGAAAGTLAAPPLAAAVDRSAAHALREGTGGAVRLDGGAGPVGVRLDVVRPPVRVVVFGAGPDARAVVRQAGLLGWTTVVVGSSSVPELARAVPEADRALALPGVADLGRLALDERTAVVVMTHDFDRDRALVAALLDATAGFVGLLGSRRRTGQLLQDLAGRGVEVPAGRLRSPVGLDLGAETPEEIALATCAEILGHVRRRALPALAERGPAPT